MPDGIFRPATYDATPDALLEAIARAEAVGDLESVAELRLLLETTAAPPLPENTDGPSAVRRTHP